MKYEGSKLQTIHPVLWENDEVILSGTTVTLHTGCPQTNSGRHQMISIHIYPSSYVWRTAIVHSKNGNRTFVVQFGSSKNPLGCFRSCVTPINISLLSGWLVLNKHGFPKRKEVIPNDDVISLWAWGWGDPPLWSRCDSEAPSLLESRVTSLCLFVERIAQHRPHLQAGAQFFRPTIIHRWHHAIAGRSNGNVSGPGLYITLPLVLRSARLRVVRGAQTRHVGVPLCR